MQRDLDELERIWELKKAGAITVDDYERLKREILGTSKPEQAEPEPTAVPPVAADAVDAENDRSGRNTGWIIFGVAAAVFLLIVAVSVSGNSGSASSENAAARENIVAADENLVAADMNAPRPSAPREPSREKPAASPTINADDTAPASPAPEVRTSASFPYFDTDAYCRKIGDTAGGSYEIEATCREEEASALSGLRSLDIPDRTLKYCSDIGETAGGSYSIMKTCVEQEANAANRL